jgi:hypothetical protein
MDNPKDFARVLARALRNEGGSGAPPAPPQTTPTGGPDDDRPWYEKWIYGVNDRLAAHDEAFSSVETICGAYEARIDALETRLAELERKPAARTVEHVRDSAGKVLRSIVVDR